MESVKPAFDFMQILPFIIPLVLVQLVLMVICLLDLVRREKVKHLPRWAWGIIIVLGQLLGPAIYLIIGRAEE